MIEMVMQIGIWVMLAATFAATLIQSIPYNFGRGHLSVYAFFIHSAWLIPVVFLSAILLGAYARGEISPLPWIEYTQQLHADGLGNAIISVMSVATVSLWSVWTAANTYYIHHPNMDRSKRVMAHVINLLFGLIITQVDNPIYRLINS